MRKVKIINLIRRYGLPLLALFLFAGFFFYCRSRVQTEFPVISPQDGVADLRDIDFDAGVYHLENHWDPSRISRAVLIQAHRKALKTQIQPKQEIQQQPQLLS